MHLIYKTTFLYITHHFVSWFSACRCWFQCLWWTAQTESMEGSSSGCDRCWTVWRNPSENPLCPGNGTKPRWQQTATLQIQDPQTVLMRRCKITQAWLCNLNFSWKTWLIKSNQAPFKPTVYVRCILWGGFLKLSELLASLILISFYKIY